MLREGSSLKKRYFIAAIAALLLTAQPLKAQMPNELKSCLADPLYVAPKQYREFARVKDVKSVYVFLHNVQNPSEVPSSVTLLKLEGRKCSRVGGHVLNPFDDISKLVPRRVAVALSEAKWRSILKFKNGPQFVRDMLNPRPVVNEMNENLSSIKLGQIDIAALRKVGSFER